MDVGSRRIPDLITHPGPLARTPRVESIERLKQCSAENEAVLATPIFPSSGFNPRLAFQHTANHDGTSDSICLRCHTIVASSHNEYSLEQAERAHVCTDPDPLAAPSEQL